MIKRWWPSTPLPLPNATSLAAPAFAAASANSSSSTSSSSSRSSGGRQAAWGFRRPPPDQEVLLPNFIHSNKYNSYYLPWDKKKNAALHRASLQVCAVPVGAGCRAGDAVARSTAAIQLRGFRPYGKGLSSDHALGVARWH